MSIVISEVLKGLFIGNYAAASSLLTLQQHGITHIVCAASDLDNVFEGQFTYLRVDLDDSPYSDMQPYFQQIYKFTDEALSLGGKVFVHCYYGMSRSATAVLSYLIMKQQIPYSEAITFLRSKHPRADPNDGFILQLNQLARNLGIQQ